MKTCGKCIWFSEEFTECKLDGTMRFHKTAACKGFCTSQNKLKFNTSKLRM